MVAFTRDEYDAVILDLDGVITQTAHVHARAWKQLFDEYLEYRKAEGLAGFAPFRIDPDYTRHIDGKPRNDGVRDFLASRGIRLPEGSPSDPPGFDTVRALGNRKNVVFLKEIERGGVEVYGDTIEQIRLWRDGGMKTGVVSSSKNCEEILQATGLSNLFDVRVDGVLAEQMKLPGKPSPDTFLEAARRLGVDPARAVVIEDAYAGVQAGRRGRFGTVVGVARQESNVLPLHEAGADVVVHTLAELPTT
jgi:beta-phosphoglucomutase family hydrolase